MRPPSPRNAVFHSLVAGSQSLSTRRLLLFLTGILVLSFTLLLFGVSHLSAPSLPSLKFDLPESVHGLKEHVPALPHVPNINPFRQSAHKPPPPQTNSTSSSEGWFSSWRWKNPFSWEVTTEQDRVALPPLEKRCRVYTYYDSDAKGDQLKTEDGLLLAWRRAWWAYGFEPVILGAEEARAHGAYEKVMRDRLEGPIEREVMKWLAWSQMGRGVLTEYTVLPMGPHDDFTLSALRRCDFAWVTRYEQFPGKLYSGDKPSVDAIVKVITETSEKPANDSATIEEALDPLTPHDTSLFRVDSVPTAIADYSPASVHEKYPALKPEDLPALINAHLHQTFLAQYPDGIAVLSPFADALAALNLATTLLAHRLARCPPSPIENSCPPNVPAKSCQPCAAPAAVTDAPEFSNSSSTFLLATVPHPVLVLALRETELNLASDSDEHVRRFVRRRTPRDPYLREITRNLVLTGVGASPRLLKIKDAVAPHRERAFISLWTTDEAGWKDTAVEWALGFALSMDVSQLGDIARPGQPTAQELQAMVQRLEVARKVRGKKGGKVRGFVEGWSLADTEAWKFVGAVGERTEVEWDQWSRSERKFGHGLAGEER